MNSSYRIIVIDHHADELAADTPKANTLGPRVEVSTSVADLPPEMRAEVIVLAVKLAALSSAIQELSALIKTDNLLVSVAAGVRADMMKLYSNLEHPIIRDMPNIGALVCRSATAAFASAEVTPAQREVFWELFTALGSYRG